MILEDINKVIRMIGEAIVVLVVLFFIGFFHEEDGKKND